MSFGTTPMFLNFDSGTLTDSAPPPTRAPLVLGVGFSLQIIVVFFVSARIIVKAKLGKLGVEDVLIIIASV